MAKEMDWDEFYAGVERRKAENRKKEELKKFNSEAIEKAAAAARAAVRERKR